MLNFQSKGIRVELSMRRDQGELRLANGSVKKSYERAMAKLKEAGMKTRILDGG